MSVPHCGNVVVLLVHILSIELSFDGCCGEGWKVDLRADGGDIFLGP